MKAILRTITFAVVLVGTAGGVQAQAATAARGGLTADLLKDVAEVEKKFVDLAGALSAAQYEWRPAPGVRSVEEVLMHVASDNYFLPAAAGVPAPAATKITATDFAAVQAFERQQLGRDATIAELKTSFAHLTKWLAAVPESRMNETMKVFGQEFTIRGFLILTATHLHEHLGQLIAYARSNNVTPPWSK